jgi:hypothetical protein
MKGRSMNNAGGYLTIARFEGEPRRLLEDYRSSSAVMEAVGHDHGLIAHVAAATEDGFMVVNLWPSRDGSESAARDPRRLGAIERARIGPGRIRREHHQVVDYVLFGR